MQKMKKLIKVLAVITLCAVVAFSTYRVTMNNMIVEVDKDGDSILATVYGHTDVYLFGD